MSDLYTITTDAEGLAILARALDLLQRIRMGQWRDVAEQAPDILGDQAGLFTEAADLLMSIRCRFTDVEALRHPNASLSIRQTDRIGQAAYDLWHACGGGMESRRSDRLTDIHVDVTRAAADD